ncbi:hypothetical protein NC651_023983 [Populus alba x Populus x berolinensis]|nr:hypothetical protein NC651_023983 [Populus alba x Populus x berolinensis]
MENPHLGKARFNQFFSYLMVLAWLLQSLGMRHLLIQVLIRFVAILYASISLPHSWCDSRPSTA